MGEEWWKRRVHMYPEDAQAIQLGDKERSGENLLPLVFYLLHRSHTVNKNDPF